MAHTQKEGDLGNQIDQDAKELFGILTKSLADLLTKAYNKGYAEGLRERDKPSLQEALYESQFQHGLQ